MRIFSCKKEDFVAIAIAYNRGHAVKLLSKELKQRDLTLEKTDPVEEIATDEKETKGHVVVLGA